VETDIEVLIFCWKVCTFKRMEFYKETAHNVELPCKLRLFMI